MVRRGLAVCILLSQKTTIKRLITPPKALCLSTEIPIEEIINPVHTKAMGRGRSGILTQSEKKKKKF